MKIIWHIASISFMVCSLQCNDAIERAPRPGETAGVENPLLTPDEGQAVCCPLPRDVNIIGDLYVGGTITGMIVVNPPLIIKPLIGNEACIIFEQADGFEKARICSSSVLDDKGVYISIDEGVTQNLRVENNGDTSLANNLNLVDSTSASVGNIVKGGTIFLQNFGTNNIFMGKNSGNFTLTGINNVAIGSNTLIANTSGTGNTAIGDSVLAANTTGTSNVGIGIAVLAAATTGNFNLAFGQTAMFGASGPTTGSENVAIGASSLRNCTSGFRNMAIGNGSLIRLTTGGNNVSIGYLAAQSITTGSSNICIGIVAGQLYTTESSNIVIGSSNNGVVGDAGVIRIGVPAVTSKCFIQGINGINIGATANIVGVVTGDQLGTTATTFTATGSISATAAITAGTGITATTGNVAITAGNLTLPNSTATTGNITKAGTLFMHNAGSNNTFLGANAGNLTVSGTLNVGIGTLALAGLTSGGSNTSIGRGSGANITTGGQNIFIGQSAGLSYTLSDSANIAIGSGQAGLPGESFTTRIGNVTGGATTRCFITGIRGITTANNNAIAVLIDSAGQLGTVSSSRRYKENIIDLEGSAQRFMQLRPVVFNYKNHTTSDIQYGLIAEEVEQVYPELVVYNQDGEVETVKYHLLYALLIKMIQENRTLSEKNDNLIQQLCLATGVVYA